MKTLTYITEDFLLDVENTAPYDELEIEFRSYDSEYPVTVFVDDNRYIPFLKMQMRGFSTGKEFWDYVLPTVKKLQNKKGKYDTSKFFDK